MMSEDTVSVVIPVYNDPGIVAAVRSCLGQTYPVAEVIIVDDGSDLDIGGLIGQFSDGRLIYVRNDRHTNANVCRNQGGDLARGDYVVFLDSDDRFMSDHIEKSLNCLKKLQVDGIYSSLIWNDGYNCRIYPASLPLDGETWANYLVRKGLSAQTSSLFLSRASAAAVRWDETLFRHQDYDFVIRYARRYCLGIKPEPTVIYNADPFRKRGVKFDNKLFWSCIRFSEDYKLDINSVVYKRYIANMLRLARASKADCEIISYYERELK